MPITVNKTGVVGVPPTVAAAGSEIVRNILGSRGVIRYVDAVNGRDGADGLTLANAQKTFSVALAAMKIDDTLLVARGGYQGDFATPLNAVAPFTNIIGLGASDRFHGAFFSSSTSTEPTLSIRARGMYIEGLEFDCPASDAGVELSKNSGSLRRPDGLEIRNCLFTGGKFGIDQNSPDSNGGSTYIHVVECIFDYQSVSAGSGISATDTGHQLPGRWKVEDSEFLELIGAMDMAAAVANHGFNSSIIGPNNTFQLKGQARDTTPALDIRGGAGNVVVANHIGGAKSTSTGGTTFEIGSNDRAVGNVFLDGVQTADFASN